MPSERLLAVSPHLDDAVFACGDLIAAHPGAVVVTVFAAGPPPDRARLFRWDVECGFAGGDDVMAIRRAEDRAALSLLRARPVWLPFRDEQYGRNGGAADVARALGTIVDDVDPSAVAVPLGIFHNDHLLTAEAALLLRAERPRPTWLAYEDAIYRGFRDDPVAARVAALRRAGVDIARAALGGWPASALKRRAVESYRSQLRGLTASGRVGYEDAFGPEAFWYLR